MKKVMHKFMGMTALMLSPTLVLAADTVGQRVDAVNQSVQTFAGLGYIVAFVLGLFLGINGLMKIKAYADNPQQNPLTKPLIYCVAGAMLMGFTVWNGIISETIAGDDGSSQTLEFESDAKK
jgi:hypothetical protein